MRVVARGPRGEELWIGGGVGASRMGQAFVGEEVQQGKKVVGEKIAGLGPGGRRETCCRRP